jgi:hypothetical protein
MKPTQTTKDIRTDVRKRHEFTLNLAGYLNFICLFGKVISMSKPRQETETKRGKNEQATNH